MHVYLIILEVLYLIITIIIAGFVVWNIFNTKKLSNVFIGAVVLVMLLLRIFLIK